MDNQKSLPQEIASEQSDLQTQTPPTPTSYQHKRMIIMIIVSLILFAVLISIGFIISQKNVQKAPVKSPSAPKAHITPTPEKSIIYDDSYVWSESFVEGGEIWACNKNLTEFPSTAQKYMKKTLFLELSGNNLSSLPITADWQQLKELDLVKNNFSATEREAIRMRLPHTKIFFTPQADFDPAITKDWKVYTNTQNHFSFQYHPDPELAVKEKDGMIRISNELGDFNTEGLTSINNYPTDYINMCQINDRYIGIFIQVKENADALSPLQFLQKDLQAPTLTEEGDHGSMIGPLKPYKNGDLTGIIYSAGESEHSTVVIPHNKKMYIFDLYSRGQTGERIGDIAKKLFENILSTVKFTD